MPGPNQQPGTVERAIASLKKEIDRLARRPAGGGTEQLYVMQAVIYVGSWELTHAGAFASAISVMSRAQFDAATEQSVSFTVMVNDVGQVEPNVAAADGSLPDFYHLRYEVVRMADATGAALSPSQRDFLDASTRTAGVVSGAAAAGTNAHVNVDDLNLYIDNPGLYHVWCEIQWT